MKNHSSLYLQSNKTKIRIPPSGKLVVSDMYFDFISRIKKLIPDIYSSNQQVFVNLEADGIFGNLLAHNNIDAENVSIDEVQSFSAAVKFFLIYLPVKMNKLWNTIRMRKL